MKAEVARKKPELTALHRLALRRLPGGEAVQMLHLGPYRDEPATIARIHELIAAEGGRPMLDHREIYLNDPLRTAPEKLKTILRVGLTR